MGTVHEITVCEDEKCPQCGNSGSVNHGLCMDCIAKKIEKRGFMKIGDKTIAAVYERLGGLLKDYQVQIDKAYLNQDEPLTVNLSVKFSPDGNGVEADCKISFTAEKIKAGVKVSVDENQQELFGTE